MNIQPIADKIPKHVKRLSAWWIAATVGLVVIGLYANQQLPVVLFKVALVCVGVLISYLADRTLFRHAGDVSIDMPPDIYSAARLLARAIIALAVILGITLGL